MEYKLTMEYKLAELHQLVSFRENFTLIIF
jgi:hypothetical protein